MKKRKKIINIVAVFFILALFILKIGIGIIKIVWYPLNHFEIVKEEASKNNIDPYLVMAIIKTESGFNKEATSNKKAKGLMQIIDTTANDVNSQINVVNNVNENLYDEKVNIALGCKYLSNLIKKYNGNYYVAICAYNAGMGNVDKWIEQGIVPQDLNKYRNVILPFNETSSYLNRVVTRYKIYRFLYK